jgi:hypothetical protein
VGSVEEKKARPLHGDSETRLRGAEVLFVGDGKPQFDLAQ